MAATCLSVVEAEDHVVAFDGIYGGRRLLFEDLLVDSLDVTLDYVDATDTDAVAAAVTEDTRWFGWNYRPIRYYSFATSKP
ncbi:PLP-dependent transferase [Natrinema sp. DC36]|uniref:PLP-dependent transferase n=1 Tax=Natrinema sp. DC36 TaxID=2878680 RepID=UPI0021054E69|nr:PLP-dependent transferase [Natrinema sp. DC36]